MTYVLSLTVPVAYDAANDDAARVIAEHIEDTIMLGSLPHAAEFLDAPGYVLEETLPDAEPRTVVAQDDYVARYAPLPAGTGAGCPECSSYTSASRSSSSDSSAAVSVETLDVPTQALPEADDAGLATCVRCGQPAFSPRSRYCADCGRANWHASNAGNRP